MKVFFFLAYTSLVIIKTVSCKNWVLLVAGSNGYDNYRHQADVCHAYHIVQGHGVPHENIITMMYDDIAHSSENPVPGNIINQPNGSNLYPGVIIDYRRDDVTPEVFLAVLSGDKAKVQQLTKGRGSKVIESGPDDHIFVNFVDHGAPGILAFPDDELSATSLKKTLKELYDLKKYKKMVFYVEACESGSMFDGLLPKTWNIFATTAANPTESSYACFYDTKRETYLGDVYSVMWMQDSDKENLKKETLSTQFSITQEETNTSHVMEYGDTTIGTMTVAEFQGNQATTLKMPPSPVSPLADAVPAPEVKLQILKKKLAAAKTEDERQQLAQKISDLMEHNSAIEQLFAGAVEWLNRRGRLRQGARSVLRFNQAVSFADLLTERHRITDWDCYTSALSTLKYSCPKLRLSQDYHALKHLHVLVNLCERRDFTDYHIRTAVMSSSLRHQALCGHHNQF